MLVCVQKKKIQMISATVIAAGIVLSKEMGWIDPDSEEEEVKREQQRKARGTEMHTVKNHTAPKDSNKHAVQTMRSSNRHLA